MVEARCGVSRLLPSADVHRWPDLPGDYECSMVTDDRADTFRCLIPFIDIVLPSNQLTMVAQIKYNTPSVVIKFFYVELKATSPSHNCS